MSLVSADAETGSEVGDVTAVGTAFGVASRRRPPVADPARRGRRGLGALVAALLVPGVPAQAHDVGGVGATNFRTTLGAVTPAVPGLTVTVIENGSRLELRNQTGTEVMIAGYAGEPYARVGPAGVFVNDNSPATYLNASRFSITAVPDTADSAKPPSWRQVDTSAILRWHDHRIHWMLATLPPIVAADPGAPHRIATWTVNLTYGGAPLTATGTLDWQPGPNPGPWLLLVALIAAALALVPLLGGPPPGKPLSGRPLPIKPLPIKPLPIKPLLGRPHRTLAVAGLVAVGAQLVHGVGVMLVEVGSVWQRLAALFGADALLVWPFAIFAAWLLWKGHTRALWIAAAAGVVMASTLVLDDAPVWWRSSAPTALSPTVNRLFVAVVVGIGLGLALALPLLLRRYGQPSRPWSLPATTDTALDPAAAPDDVATTDGAATPDRDQALEPIAVPAVGESAPADQSSATTPDPLDGLPLAPVGTIGRRQVAGALAAGTLGALAGAAAGATFAAPRPAPAPPAGTPLADVGARTVAFHGERQAGIVTPSRPQAHGWVAGFDVAGGLSRAALIALLKRWSDAAESLMAGRALGRTDDTVLAGLGPRRSPSPSGLARRCSAGPGGRRGPPRGPGSAADVRWRATRPGPRRR